ncbi:MAG: response regulator [Flavobacteriaceae bacterium]|nr:response regulator [Flavobacteriaceae bacterium]
MIKTKILWIDDEVELLKPHILFLEERGYKMLSSNNGNDALEIIKKEKFDIIILDENMPGLGGIETLEQIKLKKPNLPVIMVTKNEEEHIMEQAIGSKISDYLIKPVNPNQILLSLKKILNHKTLINETIENNYQKEFSKISLEVLDLNSFNDWSEFYKKLIYWELELDSLSNSNMLNIFNTQLKEANRLFSKFIINNYESSISQSTLNIPIMSYNLFKEKVKPEIKSHSPTLLLIIDNLRLDQWKTIEPYISPLFNLKKETLYYSILPTTTQYARNSIFSGLTPIEMSENHHNWWKNDIEEGGKNNFEEQFLNSQLNRLKIIGKNSFHKITNLKSGLFLTNDICNHSNEILTTVVYNFVDMISHAKTDMEIIKELASNNKAYRSLTLSWFKNSPLFEIIKRAAESNYKLIITTDHGTVKVDNPVEISGDKESSSNLRYKTGKNLKFSNKNIFNIPNSNKYGLPSIGMNHNYIFATGYDYLIYKKKFNHYAKLYLNSFQHGGISMQEMILPFIVYNPK